MKERPILFSGEMVRAILEGRKTQTRRVVKLPRPMEQPNMFFNVSEEWTVYDAATTPATEWHSIKCPYGSVGDRLWVKETLAADERGMFYFADNTPVNVPDNFTQTVREKLPSLFMPRWASRITLEITNVRVERLHDISEVNAMAEGIQLAEDARMFADESPTRYSAVAQFQALWDKINGKKYPWSSNPWLWVIEFPKISHITVGKTAFMAYPKETKKV